MLLNGMRKRVTKNQEAFSAFFTSVFMSKFCLQGSQVSGSSWKVWRNKDLRLAVEDLVREHLSKLDTCKCLTPDGMHPRVPGKLADVTARPLNL